MAHAPNLVHCRALQGKFYWHSATLIHSCIVSGCFRSTVAELSHCSGAHTAHKARNIYCLAILQERCADPLLSLELCSLYCPSLVDLSGLPSLRVAFAHLVIK